jgi:branched-chain amino acid transport system permease protein
MNKLLAFHSLKKATVITLWFCFLTFPVMVIKVNTYEETVRWRWQNMLYVALGSFFLSLLSQIFTHWKTGHKEKKKKHTSPVKKQKEWQHLLFNTPKVFVPVLGLLLILFSTFPLFLSTYQINIMITALMYVVLGLGLNIVVGVAGLLDLGYVAFYAVGAYSYALLNLHFGIGFWTALPLGGLLAACFGILLGFPVLRLRGDYLAIVTLGFGEIIRLVLENWTEFSHGPSGISDIPRPGFLGIAFFEEQPLTALYYFMIVMIIFTIFIVNRLQNSRIGRAWLALREDEIACQAMGIDRTKTKLTAFALGAFWAGIAGVVFAAKTTFISPVSFTFIESAIILCIVVLGGMGSIIGVIIAALVLMLLPEHLRTFADYRMLVFGASLVLMMRFRPKGLISTVRRTYRRENA